MLIMLISDKF